MRIRLTLFVSVIALIVAGCSSSDEPDAETPPTLESTAPEVVVPEGDAPDEVTVEDLVEGDGVEVTEGAYVELRYVGVLFESGEEFSSRWDGDNLFRFITGTDIVLPGLEEGLEGMKDGGQRQIIVPAAEAYGEIERQGIPSNSDLVFLVELARVFENADEPVTELGIEVLVEGDGEEVEEGGQLLVNYSGVAQSTGEEFDSSWARNEPFSFTLEEGPSGVIPGWVEGLQGQKVGSRVQLTIPGDLAYGAEGRPPSIGTNDTLIFVIEILSIPEIQVPEPGEIPDLGG